MHTSFFTVIITVLLAAVTFVRAAPVPGRIDFVRPFGGGSGGSATSGNSGNANGGNVVDFGSYGFINGPSTSKNQRVEVIGFRP